MADLNTHTLFGQESLSALYAYPWPAGYGHYRPLIERTLFGQISFWRVFQWPEGYGGPS